MALSKKLYLPVLLIVTSIFLGGCTLNVAGTDDTKTEDESSRVTIVDDEADTTEDTTDETNDDTSTDTTDDSIVDDTATDTTTTDPVETTPDPVTSTLADPKSYTGASAADSAKIYGYAYSAIGSSQLKFEWKVKSNVANQYPSYTAGYDASHNLVVTFPSLTKDFVAVETKTTDLGALLPEVTWMIKDAGTQYSFKMTKDEAYELKQEEHDGAKWLVLYLNI